MPRPPICPLGTAALKYWLGNRQPGRWRDQPEEVPEEVPEEREPIEIKITVREPASKEIPEE